MLHDNDNADGSAKHWPPVENVKRSAEMYWKEMLSNVSDDMYGSKSFPDPGADIQNPTPFIDSLDITSPEKFERIVDERLAHCQKVLLNKNKEYSRNGDRLHNFRSAAQRRGTDPMSALLGMKVKHEVSIEDMVRDCLEGRPPTRKQIAEKFGDDINYLLLLEALILEYVKD